MSDHHDSHDTDMAEMEMNFAHAIHNTLKEIVTLLHDTKLKMDEERIVQIIPALPGTRIQYSRTSNQTKLKSYGVICWALIEHKENGNPDDDDSPAIIEYQSVEAMIDTGGDIEQAPKIINYGKPDIAEISGYSIMVQE